MRACALALFLALFGAPVGAHAAALPPDFGDRVDAIVQAEMARQHVPGIEVGVAFDGAVVLERGYGSRDLAGKVPVDAKTRFALGSITKTFTANLVMQLVAAHRLGLDDHLDRYVPDAPHAHELTIRQLLTQRTGLADYLNQTDPRAVVTRDDVSPAELLGLIAGQPLGFTPGAHYAYSNTNYLLLGMVIERVTHESYDRDLQQAVFSPQQLNAMSYGRPEGADVAVGYLESGPAPIWTSAVSRGAGALWGDAADLLRFDGAFFDGRIVSPETVAMMTAHDGPLTPLDYGYGWMITDFGGHREVWHGGRVPGFTASNSIFPVDRLAIVVLGNSSSYNPAPFVRAILALIDPGVLTYKAPEWTSVDDPAVAALAGTVFRETQHGSIDRSRLTEDASRAITPQMVTAVGAQLAPLGNPTAVTLRSRTYTGNRQTFIYRLQFAAFAVDETLVIDGNGKLAGLLFRPAGLGAEPAPEP